MRTSYYVALRRGDTIDKVSPERLRTIGRVTALVALEMAAGR